MIDPVAAVVTALAERGIAIDPAILADAIHAAGAQFIPQAEAHDTAKAWERGIKNG
jgi:hypothetical protein